MKTRQLLDSKQEIMVEVLLLQKNEGVRLTLTSKKQDVSLCLTPQDVLWLIRTLAAELEASNVTLSSR